MSGSFFLLDISSSSRFSFVLQHAGSALDMSDRRHDPPFRHFSEMIMFSVLLREYLRELFPDEGDRFADSSDTLASEIGTGPGSAACFLQGLISKTALNDLVVRATESERTTWLEDDVDLSAAFPLLREPFAEQLRFLEFFPLRLDGTTLHVALAGPFRSSSATARRLSDIRELVGHAYRVSGITAYSELPDISLETYSTPRLRLTTFLETIDFIRTFGRAVGYTRLAERDVDRERIRPELARSLRSGIGRESVSLGSTRMARRLLRVIRTIASMSNPERHGAFLEAAFQVILDAIRYTLPINPALYIFAHEVDRMGLRVDSYVGNVSRIRELADEVYLAIRTYSQITRSAVLQTLETADSPAICVYGNPSTIWNEAVVCKLLQRRIPVLIVTPISSTGPSCFTVTSASFSRAVEISARSAGEQPVVQRVDIDNFVLDPEKYLPAAKTYLGFIGVCHEMPNEVGSGFVCETGARLFIDSFHRFGKIYMALHGIKRFLGYESARAEFERTVELQTPIAYAGAISDSHAIIQPTEHLEVMGCLSNE